MPIPLPQYGNYGGNGDNDAWEQVDRYLTWQMNGHVPQKSGSPGNYSVSEPPSHFTPVSISRASEEIPFVKHTLINSIDRDPKDDLDVSYLNHDLGSVGDSFMASTLNHMSMGSNVYRALTSAGNNVEWDGHLYGLASVPFMNFAGTAHSFYTQIANSIPTYNRQQIIEVEEVVVQSAGISGDYINVNYTLYYDMTWYAGYANMALSTWSAVTSLVGSVAGAIHSSFAGAGNWLAQQLKLQSNRPAGGEDLILSHNFMLFDAGHEISINDAIMLDDNKDGILSIDDDVFKYLGIKTEYGVINLDDRGVEIVLVPNGNGQDVVHVSGGYLAVESAFYRATSSETSSDRSEIANDESTPESGFFVDAQGLFDPRLAFALE